MKTCWSDPQVGHCSPASVLWCYSQQLRPARRPASLWPGPAPQQPLLHHWMGSHPEWVIIHFLDKNPIFSSIYLNIVWKYYVNNITFQRDGKIWWYYYGLYRSCVISPVVPQLEVSCPPSWSKPPCLLLTTTPALATDGGAAPWRTPWSVLVVAVNLAARWASEVWEKISHLVCFDLKENEPSYSVKKKKKPFWEKQLVTENQ